MRVLNNSPIASLFALPRADYHQFHTNGSFIFEPRVELTNYISRTIKNKDAIGIDGELWELFTHFFYQLNNEWQIGLKNSFIKHGGGITDRFIFHFHDLLQLPQNGRSDLHHDRLFWSIISDNQQIVSLNEPTSGFTDTEISAHWQPGELNNTQINFVLKIPTGEYAHFSGSGETDFNVSLSQINPDWFSNRNFLQSQSLALWYGLGVGYIGEIKQTRNLNQSSLNIALRTGLAWLVSPRLELKAQLDSHSPLFNTEIRELGWIPLQISMGLAYQPNRAYSFEFFIVEDLRPRSAPDVTLSSAIKFVF